jgi:hypothetical protein
MPSANVTVSPGIMPAIITVAPNSPSARAKANTVPAASPRRASGSRRAM